MVTINHSFLPPDEYPVTEILIQVLKIGSLYRAVAGEAGDRQPPYHKRILKMQKWLQGCEAVSACLSSSSPAAFPAQADVAAEKANICEQGHGEADPKQTQ